MSGEGLTEAEREALDTAAIAVNGYYPDDLFTAVERILADRLAAVQAERDAAERSKSALVATVKRPQDQIARAAMEPGQDRQKAMHAYAARAEAAEAERDAALAALDRVKALADEWDDEAEAGRTGNGHPLLVQTYAGHATDLRASVEGGAA